MADDFKTYEIYAPQVTADPFRRDVLFSMQLKVVKTFWKSLIYADNFRAARWNQGGLTYMLYHSVKNDAAFVIGVLGTNELPLSHHTYLKDEVGTGKYYADILLNLPHGRKKDELKVTVVES